VAYYIVKVRGLNDDGFGAMEQTSFVQTLRDPVDHGRSSGQGLMRRKRLRNDILIREIFFFFGAQRRVSGCCCIDVYQSGPNASQHGSQMPCI
jgi:hypothetical protein